MRLLSCLFVIALGMPALNFADPSQFTPSKPIHQSKPLPKEGFQKSSFSNEGEKMEKRPRVNLESTQPANIAPAATKYFGHPGIVASRNGEWLWSDHLFNLSKNITIAVEVAKPDDLELSVDVDRLESLIGDVFKKYGISPGANPDMGKPDLPNFHVLVMIYPIKDGYTFAVNADLLEPVLLTRIKLDETVTMQAVTWDRQSIHIVSKSNFNEELEKSVQDAATGFAERYAFFDKMRTQEKQ